MSPLRKRAYLFGANRPPAYRFEGRVVGGANRNRSIVAAHVHPELRHRPMVAREVRIERQKREPPVSEPIVGHQQRQQLVPRPKRCKLLALGLASPRPEDVREDDRPSLAACDNSCAEAMIGSIKQVLLRHPDQKPLTFRVIAPGHLKSPTRA